MIFARPFWKRRPAASSPEHRSAELATTQAVTAFIASGVLPLALTVPAGHRQDGLSGARAIRMLSVHAAAFANKADRGTAALEDVRRSLSAEIDNADTPDGPSPRRLAHVRTLLAFATGLWAYRSAEAKRRGAVVDAAEVAAAANRAACMLREEPYLRALQAETLILLGRADEAADALAPVVGAPWLEEWKDYFTSLLAESRSSTNLLPLTSAHARLRAMSEQEGWLTRAGAELPRLLLGEAAGAEPLAVSFPTFELTMSAGDLEDENMQRLLGTEDADARSSTILGLQKALAERFGVVLPLVSPRKDVTLPAGYAVVAFEGRRVAGTDTADLALAARVEWWPGAAAAPPTLRALLVAAERTLVHMNPSLPNATRSEEEARALMLADRMPYRLLSDRMRQLLANGADPVSTVAALRLSLADGVEKAPIWGNEEGRTLLLLDRASEEAFQAGIVPGMGVAAASEVFAKLTATLRKRLRDEQSDSGEWETALVVRDTSLRPLIRALLQNEFPDLPVLAMAEITGGRSLVPLDETTAWTSIP